jgi:hypothetical protein
MLTLEQVITAFVAWLDARLATAVATLLAGGLKGDPGPAGSGQSFGGRLTLAAGEPCMVSDQIAKQTIYYAPYAGDSVPMAPGKFVTDSNDQIGLALDLAGSSAWPADTTHDIFMVRDGEALRLASRQWDAAMIATEEQITGGTTISSVTESGYGPWTTPGAAFDGNPSQGYAASARLYPAAPGMNNFIGRQWATPQAIARVEIVAANNNFLVNSGTAAAPIKFWGSNDGAHWFMLGFATADCSANGNTNSFSINVSNRTPYLYHRIGIDPGGNTWSINIAELKFYRAVEPVTRRLTRLAGLRVNDATMTVRKSASETLSVNAGEGLFLGVFRTDPDAPGRVTAHAEYGPSRMYNLWNAHNQRQIVLRAGVPTPDVSSYALVQPKWGPCQSAAFSMDVLVGLAEDQVAAAFYRSVFLNAVTGGTPAYDCGIAVDNTSSFSGKWAGTNLDHTGQTLGTDLVARLVMPKYAGTRKLTAIERNNGDVKPAVDQRSTVLEAIWMG